MTYQETAVTPELLAVLWSRLWQRGRDEFAAHDMSLQDAFWLFLRYAQDGRSGILLADGEPVLVAGIAPDRGTSFTWFQATDDFEKHALAITRTLRKAVKAHDGPLHIFSVLIHPKAERWFKSLGFNKDNWEGRTAAGKPLYRFGRQACA